MPTTPRQWIHSYVRLSLVGAKVTVRAPARLRTYTLRSPSYGLLRRRLLPRWVSWDSEQHQEVPVHIGSACLYGSGMHALQLLHRLPTTQREHGHPRGQVQPTRLHQRARAALVLPSRGTLAPRRTWTRPLSKRTASRTQSSSSLARIGVRPPHQARNMPVEGRQAGLVSVHSPSNKPTRTRRHRSPCESWVQFIIKMLCSFLFFVFLTCNQCISPITMTDRGELWQNAPRATGHSRMRHQQPVTPPLSSSR